MWAGGQARRSTASPQLALVAPHRHRRHPHHTPAVPHSCPPARRSAPALASSVPPSTWVPPASSPAAPATLWPRSACGPWPAPPPTTPRCCGRWRPCPSRPRRRPRTPRRRPPAPARRRRPPRRHPRRHRLPHAPTPAPWSEAPPPPAACRCSELAPCPPLPTGCPASPAERRGRPLPAHHLASSPASLCPALLPRGLPPCLLAPCPSHPPGLALVPPCPPPPFLPPPRSWPRTDAIFLALDPTHIKPYDGADLWCDASPFHNHLSLTGITKIALPSGTPVMAFAGNAGSFGYRAQLAPGSLPGQPFTGKRAAGAGAEWGAGRRCTPPSCIRLNKWTCDCRHARRLCRLRPQCPILSPPLALPPACAFA